MSARKPASAKLRTGHPLAQGLIGAWFFTEGSGSDTGGNQTPSVFDCSATNAPTYITFTDSTQWTIPPGINSGYALKTSGSNTAQVAHPIPPVLNLIGSPWSAVALVYPLSFGGASKGRIIDNLTGGLSGWDLYIDNANVTSAYSVQLDSTAVRCNANSAVLNTWQHVAFTIDPAFNFHFYVNAVDAGNNGGGSNAGQLVVNGGAGVNLNIGDFGSSGGRLFDGWIDHVLVYNRALSANEVAQLYADPYQIIKPRIPFISHNVSGFGLNPVVSAQAYRPSRTSIVAY